MLHAAAAADPLSRAATIAILIRQKAHEQLRALRAPRRCALAAVAPQQRRNASPQRRNASLLGAQSFVTDCGSRVGGRNSPRFLSMQRPKPVDTGRAMSGF